MFECFSHLSTHIFYYTTFNALLQFILLNIRSIHLLIKTFPINIYAHVLKKNPQRTASKTLKIWKIPSNNCILIQELRLREVYIKIEIKLISFSSHMLQPFKNSDA